MRSSLFSLETPAEADSVRSKIRSTGRYESRKATSRNRIMTATIEEIGAHGTDGMSFSGIAAKAGMSRTTLYAHFSTKDEILDAVNAFIRTNFELELRIHMAEIAGPKERLLAIFHFMRSFHERWVGDRLVNLQEDAIVNGIRNHFTSFCSLLQDLLATSFDALDKASGYKLDRRLFVETIIRVQLSAAIVKLDNDWDALPERIAVAYAFLVGGDDDRQRSSVTA